MYDDEASTGGTTTGVERGLYACIVACIRGVRG